MLATLTRRKAKESIPRRIMSDKQRLGELKAFVRLCFALIGEDDLKEIVNRTHLSISTLRRLALEEYTLAIRWGTIQRLSAAAGVRLVLTKTTASMELV